MDSNTNDLLRNIGISAVSALPVCGSVLGYLLDKKIPEQIVVRYSSFLEDLEKEYKVYKVDATEESKKLGNPKVFNLIVLGVAAQHMDFTKEQWYEVIEKTVPQKTVELNKKAFDVGYTLK